jgi:ABC-2 type transport system ATP-binding protein
MIRILGISKSFGKKIILDNIHIEIKSGEIFGLVGANGAGKTTLLSILATIERPDKGHIFINECNLLKEIKKAREFIGYVPQDIALWQQLTVEENLLFWNRFAGGNKKKTDLIELARRLGLEDKWKSKVNLLSGGTKRKLNMAVALLHDPEILLMDEPTVGIDIQSKLEINRLMKALAKQGKTIIYTTHDSNEILLLCDRIGVLKDGRFSFVGTMAEALKVLKLDGKFPISEEEALYWLLNG